jgi:hypothetical protein
MLPRFSLFASERLCKRSMIETRFRTPPAPATLCVAHLWRFVGFETLLLTSRTPFPGSMESGLKKSDAIYAASSPCEKGINRR